MARMGRANINGFKELKEKMQKLGGADKEQFIEDCAKELALRLLSRVIRRTPVGQYPNGSGKTGGTLRRGWTGGDVSGAQGYARSLKINKTGTMYSVEIVNPISYASYVEFGHRMRDHKGWVPGRFMLTISEQEIRQMAPQLLENRLRGYLGGIFNDK